jgi:3-deoxy-D-manno-octulosonic-acid transferase
MYFCLKPHPLTVVYNFAIQLVNAVLPALGLFNKKVKKGVIGRKKTLNFLLKNIGKGDTVFWFHCASLGEYEQGLPVFKNLKSIYPKAKIVLSFFSPSGYEIRQENPITPLVVYLPMDTKKNVTLFLKTVRPSLVVFVKYELWPNYLLALKSHFAKVFLISALFRPQQYFFKPFFKKWRQLLYSFDHIFSQDKGSKALLKGIGFNQVTVSNDTRFDRVSSQLEQNNSLAFVEAFIDNKICIIAGSTWQEDHALLESYIEEAKQDLKFIIAPHKIEKQRIQKLKNSLGDKAVLYTNYNMETLSKKQVLIVDTVGLLTKLYQYAKVAYIGGAMGSTGLHNTLEAAVFGVPIIIGRNYDRFPEAKAMLAQGGLVSVGDASSFKKALDAFLDDENFRHECGQKNKTYIDKNKGATALITKNIQAMLNV